MGRMPWAIYLWPGLPLVWKRGEWCALGVALASAVLVQFALLASLVWPGLLPAAIRSGLWLSIVAWWAAAAIMAWRRESRTATQDDPTDAEDSFSQAIKHYLRGNWFETECVLKNLLRRNPRDVEAGLMLATLYRHTGRTTEAVEQLDRLERIEEAARWALEIAMERRWATEDRAEATRQPREVINGE
jgi:hypothetical protein